jgi:hypothetical protein
MKPFAGGGWKSVYKVNDPQDLFNKHAETGQLVMMLQEEIVFDSYFRCYCLGGDNVHIMQYEPRNPHHLRYVRDGGPIEKKLLATIEKQTKQLNHALGYDFNTVEFAVRDGIAYAIDFCNPAPDADVNSVGQDNFDWIVENAANMAIARAKAHKDGQMNLTWGSFIRNAAAPAATQAAAKPKAKAAVKPAAKPVSKDAAKPAAKPVAKSTAKPVAKSSAKKSPAKKK